MKLIIIKSVMLFARPVRPKESLLIMNRTIKTLVLTMATIIMAFNNVSCIDSNDSIEYWKPYLAKKYGYFHSDKNDKPFFDSIRDNYLEERFNSMIQDPNEYQSAYLKLAKEFCDKMDWRNTNDLEDRVTEFIDKQYIHNNYHFNGPSEEVIANIRSHPELYAENICKILGPIKDLRAEFANHVKAKKVEKENSSGYNRYYVLYSFDDEYFAIVCITEKEDEQSEIQFVSDEKSINDILDQWEYINME